MTLDPYYDKTGSIVYLGDCLNVMGEMEDNSVDAIVTDAPYGISFMGKKWDYKIPDIKVWKQCLRVLKPGSHLLCFAGTRTQHRMTVNIEDAGFEIRDTIGYLYSTQDRFRMLWDSFSDEQRKLFHQVFDVDNLLGWGYGSGFPKSTDIGKKQEQDAGMEREVVGAYTVPADSDAGNAGKVLTGSAGNQTVNVYSDKDGPGPNGHPITAPATPEAKQWDGWGTNLKPAIEIIVMCRKPVSEKTIAANVLRWGTGGLNIDGCRVEIEEDCRRSSKGGENGLQGSSTFRIRERHANDNPHAKGRWPANLMLDDSEQVRELFPETKSGESKSTHNRKNGYGGQRPANVYGKYKQIPFNFPSSAGSATRFFYVAKSSTAERSQFCEDEDKNTHSTVKPVSLMRQLIRLITPPGGTVLDPFSGSGSTLVAAQAEGFKAIGIELEEKYCTITVGRLRQPSLFSV